MPPSLNRRLFILGSLASVVSACSQRRSHSSPQPYTAPITPVTRQVMQGHHYTVQRGDTLSSISRRSGLTISEIVSANTLDSNIIYPGSVLVLPGVQRMGDDPLSIQDEPVPAYTGNYKYRIIPRSSWTKQSVRENNALMGAVNRITLHHTGEHGDIAKLPDVEVVKIIENYHRNERNWAAIGYHYLVGRDGAIYEGRPARFQGAHTRSNNRNNLGISMIGDFNQHKASALQLNALTSLLGDMRSKYNVAKRNVFGHRDLSPSICPGKYMYAWLQNYKIS